MITAFAPAKINLALHITGQRDDGYHLLDSLVVFADIGDRLTFQPSDARHLEVTGPFAKGVPTGPENLIWKAVDWFDPALQLDIRLEKNLPHAAGIGSGSADAAAMVRALREWRPGGPNNGELLRLGADIPVCTHGLTSRMRGIGEVLGKVRYFPPLPAVLVNPNIPIATGSVFAGLSRKDNAPMSPPDYHDGPSFIDWLRRQRNDLEAPARRHAPGIETSLGALQAKDGCSLSRMSGSGATCFGLFDRPETAKAAALDIAADHSDWWVQAVTLSDGGTPIIIRLQNS